MREWIAGKEGIFREDLLSTDERDERQRSPQSSAWRPWRAAPWTERNRGNTGTFVASIDQIWCRVTEEEKLRQKSIADRILVSRNGANGGESDISRVATRIVLCEAT